MFRARVLIAVTAVLGVLCGAAPALAGQILQPQPIKGRQFLRAYPDEVEFGTVDVHGSGARQTIKFEDAGLKQREERVRSVKILGKGDSFQITDDQCTGKTIIRIPESCTVEVAFAPDASVASSATLELVTEEVEEGAAGEVLQEVEVPLSGEGIIGTISASSNPLEFSPIPYTGSGAGGEGEQNETKEVTIRAGSKAGVQAGSVSITGPDADSFSIQYGDCEDRVLEPENTCDVDVRFQPRAIGPQHAQLEISSDSAGGPLVVALEGDGLLGPQVSFNTTQASLGEVDLGSSVTQTFTLTNTGDYPLGVQQAPLISGTPLMFPISSDTCTGKVIQAGAACAVTVSFQPTSTGVKSASILFITSSSLPLHIVGIEGVGVPATTPLPAIAPAPSVPASLLALPGQPPSSSSPSSLYAAPWLSVIAPALRYGRLRERALDTGVNAICPAASAPCEVVSFIGASIPAPVAYGAPRGGSPASVVLGSSSLQLRGGARARVRIHLSEEALSLLKEHRRLPTTVEFAVRVRGALVAMLSRAVTLVS